MSKKTDPSIVRVATADDLYLHGFFQPGDTAHAALLHIHGFEGNFYENHFLDVISEQLKQEHFGWLPVNNRGNGKITDFNTVSGTNRTIGARSELLEDAHLDIDAWIEFLLHQGYKSIVLMGHSLGTYKVARYLFEGKYKDQVTKLILVSPFDAKGLLETAIPTPLEELLAEAAQMVATGKGEELISPKFDTIVLSYQTYLSWYQRSDFGRCFEFCDPDYDFPLLKKITIPVKVICGTQDEYFHQSNPGHPDEAMNILARVLPHGSTALIPQATHSYAGHEQALADEILKFLQMDS